MEKKFFEAFPNLKLEGVQKDLFEQVVVEKITATKRKDLLRVYIRSERLIDKEAVFAVEREIKKQFRKSLWWLRYMSTFFYRDSIIRRN